MSFLNSCVGHRGAKLLHSRLYKNGSFKNDVYSCNSLINLYLGAGDSISARKLFDEMPQRNCVTWACIISGYTRNNQHREALLFLKNMIKDRIFSNQYAFGSAIRSCQELEDNDSSSIGKQIHGLIYKLSYAVDAVVSNVVISMYWKSLRSLDYALRAFDDIKVKNPVSWNSMISVYSQSGDQESAFKMFSCMQCDDCRPTEYTFGSLITAACSLSDLDVELLEQIMCSIEKCGFLDDLFVGSGLVNAFAKSSSLTYARKLFNQMETRNAVTLNGLMVGLVKQRHGEEATKLFIDMKSSIHLSPESYVILLSSFPEFENEEEGLRKGKEVHGFVITNGLFDFAVGIGNGIVNMYSKCGSIDDAKRVFGFMVVKDSVSWNSMITGLDQNGLFQEAIECYQDMRRRNEERLCFTLISTLSSCASLKFVRLGRQIHGESVKLGLDSNVSVANTLMTVYAESCLLKECRKVFALMAEHDQVSWNTMIGALDSSEEAVVCFVDSLRDGYRLNRITFVSLLSSVTSSELAKQLHSLAIKYNIAKETITENALIACYGKSSEMEDCEKIFSRMFDERRDNVTYNSMISSYIHNENLTKALELLRKGEKLDCFIYATVLSAFASVATLESGMELHARSIRACLESDVVVGSAIVDMYSKCGRLDYALRLFNTLEAKNKNSYTWNSMISGLARHGKGEEALKLFEDMKKETEIQPDHVTFVGVLSACSHSGLVEQGFKHFESIKAFYGLAPKIEHYSCMVDLLGRAGKLEVLESFIEEMEIEPNVLIWRTVLGACVRANGRKSELGKKAAEMLFRLEPKNAVNYVLLGNMYASEGKWEDLEKTRKFIRDNGVNKKETGSSWVTMKDGVHSFVSGDKSHRDSDLIYEKLKEMNKKMRDAGYVPEIGFALYDVEEENKQEVLSYHSEKLALAYVLMVDDEKSLMMKKKKTIRIMKNLRVCGDCHSAFKFISKIEAREIVLRDSNRFHHFRDGDCSCCDFW